jgi:hypothetical protein
MAESIQITVTKWDLGSETDMLDTLTSLHSSTQCGGGVTVDPDGVWTLHINLDGKAPVEASVGDVVVFSVAGVDSMSSSEFTSRYGGS